METLHVFASPEHHHCSISDRPRHGHLPAISPLLPFVSHPHLVQSDLPAPVLLITFTEYLHHQPSSVAANPGSSYHPRIPISASPYPSLFGLIIPGVAVVAFHTLSSRCPFDSLSPPSLPLSRNSRDTFSDWSNGPGSMYGRLLLLRKATAAETSHLPLLFALPIGIVAANQLADTSAQLAATQQEWSLTGWQIDGRPWSVD